jgi:hypothetical protein
VFRWLHSCCPVKQTDWQVFSLLKKTFFVSIDRWYAERGAKELNSRRFTFIRRRNCPPPAVKVGVPSRSGLELIFQDDPLYVIFLVCSLVVCCLDYWTSCILLLFPLTTLCLSHIATSYRRCQQVSVTLENDFGSPSEQFATTLYYAYRPMYIFLPSSFIISIVFDTVHQEAGKASFCLDRYLPNNVWSVSGPGKTFRDNARSFLISVYCCTPLRQRLS